MIHFCLVHTAYHLYCWLPRSHRLSQVMVFLCGVGALTLQFYVLLRPRSSRYCSQPLLANLVGNIVFTFFMLGLIILLTQMEPAPQALRAMLAVFGVGSFGEGVCTLLFTVLASDCEKTTPELYYLSVLLSAGSLVSMVLFSGMGLISLYKVTCPRPGAKPTV
ncbi:Tmem274 [Phodopus roborovskii]|uniref:Tmem274 protein n=1 Tax=Phodopus roborovskii TaxID=109678 RepID=A0AAV0AAI4_PHORO|nr:Tmem274 [Phodopus roborovskii]